MPLIEVKLFDFRVSEETSATLRRHDAARVTEGPFAVAVEGGAPHGQQGRRS